MALIGLLHVWVLVALAIGTSHAQRNTCTPGFPHGAANCLRGQGRGYASTYCSSVLKLSTPTSTKTITTTDTLTVKSTETTATVTVKGTPPITTSVTDTTAIDKTKTLTNVETTVVATSTLFVGTTTVTSTEYSIAYTCSSSGSSLTTSSSDPTTASHHSKSTMTYTSSWKAGNHSISGTGSLGSPISASTTCDTLLEKRATLPSVTSTPECLGKFSSSHGAVGVTSACQCLAIATPSAVTSTITKRDRKTTATSTSTIKVATTTTVTPVTTTTKHATTVYRVTETTTATEKVTSVADAIRTITTTTTSIVTSPYPVPTSFNIYYKESNATKAPANFFKAVRAPGKEGYAIAPEAEADTWSLKQSQILVDLTVNRFMSKNTDNVRPFELLQTQALTSNTPTCSACNGTLQCDYPGTKGNTFALCEGYLALGKPKVFLNRKGSIRCKPFVMRYK